MDKETKYAHVRLSTMVRHNWPNTAYDSALLCRDVGLVLAALEDERGKRERAEAAALRLRDAADRFHYAVAMNKLFDGRFDQLTRDCGMALMAAIRTAYAGKEPAP